MPKQRVPTNTGERARRTTYQKQSLGPLHGIPTGPKRYRPLAGLVTTNGSPIFAVKSRKWISRQMHAAQAVRSLLAAPTLQNSVLVRTPITASMAPPVMPLIRHTQRAEVVVGAGVALALRMLPVADGSDMMGSLRVPAAFNNVFGFRPLVGCVPHGPGDEVFFQQFSVYRPHGPQCLILQCFLGYKRVLIHDRRSPADRTIHANLPNRWSVTCAAYASAGSAIPGGHWPMDPELLTLTHNACPNTLKRLVARLIWPSQLLDFEQLWRAWIHAAQLHVFGRARTALPRHGSLTKPTETRGHLGKSSAALP